jgi:hypothetical protein
LEKIAAYDGQCNGFFNKNIGNYPYKQYSFIKGDGGMEYAMSTLMLGNGTLEGILEQLRMKWDILGSNTFWLQMSLSIHGWTKGLQPMFQI